MKRSFVLIGMLFVLFSTVGPLSAQESTAPIVSPIDRNPVFQRDSDLGWEAGYIIPMGLTEFDGKYYLFYVGAEAVTDDAPRGLGMATSDDGITWTRNDGNPVFAPDGQGGPVAVFHNGVQWVMLFRVWDGYEASDLLLATAPAPEGPWTVADEPALELGGAMDWDYEALIPNSVVQAGDEFRLYYSSNGKIGLATSADGLVWTKYDNPSTTDRMVAASDPVFERNRELGSWDSNYVIHPFVRPTEDGFEMFYGGSGGSHEQIGYATSTDGITWARVGDAPVLDDDTLFDMSPLGLVQSGDDPVLIYVGNSVDEPSDWFLNAASVDAP